MKKTMEQLNSEAEFLLRVANPRIIRPKDCVCYVLSNRTYRADEAFFRRVPLALSFVRHLPLRVLMMSEKDTEVVQFDSIGALAKWIADERPKSLEARFHATDSVHLARALQLIGVSPPTL